MDALLTASAAEQAAAVRSGAVSAEALVRAHIERIEAVNPTIRAVVCSPFERALARARALDADLARGDAPGPLHGVPMTIKDSFDVAGVVSTGGTTGRAGFVPDSDAVAVARLRAAGAVILGKTNTPELTLSFITDNLLFGPTFNPYDPDRSPGGSSGGAAAIVAACGSALELGSDLGGSIRVPAHYCGVIGIKPTPGTIPRTGHIFGGGGLLDHFSTVGPIARHVGDVALAMGVLMGADPPKLRDVRGLRVAAYRSGCVASEPAVVHAIEAAAGILQDAGAEVVWVTPPALAEAWVLVVLAMEADMGARFRDLLRANGTTTPSPSLMPYAAGPTTDGIRYARYLLATDASDACRSPYLAQISAAAPYAPLSAAQVAALPAEIDRVRLQLSEFIEDYDAILGPVSSGAAPLLDRAGEAQYSDVGVHNLSRFPAVAVRASATDSGLPVGVQIAAKPGRDDIALSAAAIEARRGWIRPRL